MVINSTNIIKQQITSHLNWIHWTQKNNNKKPMTYDVGHPGPGLRGIDLNISVLHIVCYYMSMVDILIYMYFIL